MVKTPISPVQAPPEFVEHRTQLLHDFGAFLALWSEFELALEVKIARLAGLSPLNASIIIGGLNFGNKPAILYALLDQIGETGTAEKVRAVIDNARRNALVHGLVISGEDPIRFAFSKREIKNSYRVTHAEFTSEAFNQHFEQFRVLQHEALLAMGLNIDDLEEYGHEARLFEPTPSRPQGRPQNGANG